MIYHLLTEAEPFSEFRGGAISRWVANVVREDDDAVVVAPSIDESWGHPKSRLLALAGLQAYGRLKYRVRLVLPRALRALIVGTVLRPLISRIGAGDVVWVHNRPEFAAAISQAVRKRGARLVLHLHNSHVLEAHPATIEALENAEIIFVSEYLKKEACDRYPRFQSANVIYNGADETVFVPRPRKDAAPSVVRALFAGRLVRDKGAHVFSAALKLLLTENLPIEGVVVGSVGFGDRKRTDYVRDLVADAPPNLRFEEYRVGAALAALFREADIFCVPSIWNEPLSLALLEGMASRLPVIASCSGGMVEVLDGGAGLLVERNSPQALADALRQLVLDKVYREALADAGYAAFRQRFRWSSVRQAYRCVLDACPA